MICFVHGLIAWEVLISLKFRCMACKCIYMPSEYSHGGSRDSGGHGESASEAPDPASSAVALLPPFKMFLGEEGALSGNWGRSGSTGTWVEGGTQLTVVGSAFCHGAPSTEQGDAEICDSNTVFNVFPKARDNWYINTWHKQCWA